ncbi:MAG: large ribosomal subunit protein bL35, partial [Phycisphaerales bacterium]
MPKMKTHKGLLKRIRLTKTGLARHKKSGSKHLRSHKSPKRLRRLRQDAYASTAVTRRLTRLLGVSVRGREQPASAARRSPSPAE